MTDLFTTTPDEEDMKRIALRRLPREDKRALVDVDHAERHHVQDKWNLRQMILSARSTLKAARQLKRRASRDRK